MGRSSVGGEMSGGMDGAGMLIVFLNLTVWTSWSGMTFPFLSLTERPCLLGGGGFREDPYDLVQFLGVSLAHCSLYFWSQLLNEISRLFLRLFSLLGSCSSNMLGVPTYFLGLVFG